MKDQLNGDQDLTDKAAAAFQKARGKQAPAATKKSLSDAITDFVQKYWTADSHIVSVGQGDNCIHVVVNLTNAASKLPVTFEGYSVSVVHGTGNLEKQNGPGNKTIIRGENGQVIGSQG